MQQLPLVTRWLRAGRQATAPQRQAIVIQTDHRTRSQRARRNTDQERLNRTSFCYPKDEVTRLTLLCRREEHRLFTPIIKSL